MNIKLTSRKENIKYITIIFILVVSCLVFFSSKSFMNNDSPNNQTPFNEVVKGLDQSDIILKKWNYDKELNVMEIYLQIQHVGSDAVKPHYSFLARTRNSANELPMEIAHHDGEFFILKISEVPEDYEAIGLFINEKRDEKMLKYELSNQDMTEDEMKQSIKDYEGEEVRIVGDFREVNNTSILEKNSRINYSKNIIMIELEDLNIKINNYESKIKMEKEIITALKDDINVMKEGKSYQTETEKEETDRKILSKESEIADAKKKQEEMKDEIKSIKETIKIREKQMNNLAENINKK